MNPVLTLRKARLAQSQRPFAARGSKLVRCQGCLLAQSQCVCEYQCATPTDVAFCLVMYAGEAFKPSNTGRLIADIATESYAFQWHRTEPPEEMLALFENPKYQVIVVFPHDHVKPGRECITQMPPTQGKIPLFVLFDGTWREAKKMFHRSPYLESAPVLALNPQQISDYRLRNASFDHHLCTAEVGIELLHMAGEHQASENLGRYFEAFKHHYLIGKNQKHRTIQNT